MTRFLAAIASGALAGLLSLGPVVAQDALPERRMLVYPDTDMAGTDLQQLFDTTVSACRNACLADDDCTALTFNTRNNSCFPKSSVTGTAPYDGAYSARLIAVPQAARDLGALRLEEVRQVVTDDRLETARDLAERISWIHPAGDTAPEVLRQVAGSSRQSDPLGALRLVGAVVAATDDTADWAEYADLLLAADPADDSLERTYRRRALPAAINAYLRAGSEAARANALFTMARAFEENGYGEAMIPVLRLAADLSPRRDIADLLTRAQGLYGFSVEDYDVDSSSALPKTCIRLSEPLAKTGVDYGDYVQLPDSAMAVETDGYELCITGGTHGYRYTVTLRAGLPSRSGETLADSHDITFTIPDRDPQVHFPGRGYVLAAGAGAALPVETVNLDRLDLTLFKVTDRNILRAIQREYFGEQVYEWALDEVGTEIGTQIWTGEAELRKEPNQEVTTRLPLDAALAGQSPGVYALRARVPDQEEWEYGPATQWFIVSDLGMTSWSGADGLHAIVRGLSDAGPKPGVELSLLSSANEVLATATTDDQGIASFAAGLLRGTGGMAPALLLARDGDSDMAFLSLTSPAFDLSDRGVAGREAAGAIDVFLATDRGAYRAGETIHLTALARDGVAQAIDGLPVTAILTRPDGVEYARRTLSSGQAGGYDFAFPTTTTAPRGTWRLSVKSDLDAEPLATKTVLVEDFLPERIDADLSLSGDGPMSLVEARELSVDTRYLFGAPGAGLKVYGDYVLRPATTLDARVGYHFGLYDAENDPERFYFDQAETDDAGHVSLPVAFEGYAQEVPMPAQMTVTARVLEGSGRPIERRLTETVLPAEPFLGIRPQFDDVVPEGSDAAFQIIALDPALQPVPMDVVWHLNRVETRYQWYNQWGSWEWESFTTRTEVASGTATLGADPVTVSGAVDWGHYELVVEAADNDRTAASMDFYAGWYVPADPSATPDTLDLSLDADRYAPGDTANLRIVPRYDGTALVSVMSNRLIDMKVVPVTKGENIIPLDVTADWGAGAYVTATVLRPMDLAQGHNPARAIGLDYTAVDPGARALSVAFDTPAKADPRGRFTADLTVTGITPGEQAWVRLAAVDLGILNLTGFTTPDPQAHYFGQRRLGMEIRDLYGRLIDPLQGEMGRVRSGGDAAGGSGFAAPPPTEDLVAWVSAPLPVDGDGHVSASFDIPAFNGTIRLMALGWSATGVGSAQSDLLVRDPVVVTASLPNLLAPGDTAQILLEAVHASGPTGQMQLALTAPGLSLGAEPAPFTLTEGATARFRLPVTATEEGDFPLTVALTTPDGRVLTKQLTLPVRRNTPEVSTTRRFDLAAGATFTLDADAFAGFDPETAHAVISSGALARLDVPGVLSLLDQYPYGCSEQITSKALPLLSLAPVADELGLATQAKVAYRVTTAIDTLLTRQEASGAFRLWPGSDGTPWLDAYVTDFLSRARAAGYAVPDAAYGRALDNLRNQVNFASDFEADTNGGGEALAYQLMVLAREGTASMGDLRYYADVKGADFATPLAAAQLGTALAFYGDQQRADAMFDRAAGKLPPMASAEARLIRADFGTGYRDAAGLLALSSEARSTALDRDALVARLTAHDGPLSTQESAWTLMAASALLQDPTAAGLTVNGDPVGTFTRTLPGTASDTLAIRNTGATSTALTLTTIGVPDGPLDAGGYGYAISRSYYTPEGDEVAPTGARSGERMVVVLTITPYEEAGARLMVTDPLPGGFQIDNPRLLSSGDIAAFDWLDTAQTEMAEFRSDRFFAALDWSSKDSFTLAYVVRAVTPGDYLLPAASVEDMYRPRYRANTAEARITVTE